MGVTILVCIVLVVLDQLAKWLAVQYLMPVGVLPAVPGIFEWKYVENTGAAFSFLAGKQNFLIIFTGLALLIVAYILLFRRPKGKLEYIAILLIFSGGVGNWIDRAMSGYVVDFVSLLFMKFAVFNVADIYVTIGFALFVVAVFRSEIMSKKKKEDSLEEHSEEGSVSNGTD